MKLSRWITQEIIIQQENLKLQVTWIIEQQLCQKTQSVKTNSATSRRSEVNPDQFYHQNYQKIKYSSFVSLQKKTPAVMKRCSLCVPLEMPKRHLPVDIKQSDSSVLTSHHEQLSIGPEPATVRRVLEPGEGPHGFPGIKSIDVDLQENKREY